jgi:hypothetical protein
VDPLFRHLPDYFENIIYFRSKTDPKEGSMPLDELMEVKLQKAS